MAAAAPFAAPAQHARIDLGPRPLFLVNDMEESPLKQQLLACLNDEPRRTNFSIGHRGAALQFPEHTKESYEAAARMGAGVIECDVTFTKDMELVCRHAQDDLATTTNILVTPLADKCTKPFTPAKFDSAGRRTRPATAECRASDVTLAEFKSLRGKMDAYDPNARTPEQYLGGTPTFRTDLYAGPTSGTLLTHAESIALIRDLGARFTPELKEAVVRMPFDGFTQEAYAQKLIDDYRAASIDPGDVYPQSFSIDDVRYWMRHEPEFGRQAVFLDDANFVAQLPSRDELAGYAAEGIAAWAPPLFALLDLDENGDIVPSKHALWAKELGLPIVAWTLERSGRLADRDGDFYYKTIDRAITREGDVMRVLDVLAREVQVRGVFSDWPATTTFYASCMGLK